MNSLTTSPSRLTPLSIKRKDGSLLPLKHNNYFTDKWVEAVLNMYPTATYLGEFSLFDECSLLFYEPIAHPEGSNYFKITKRSNPFDLDSSPHIYISNGVKEANFHWKAVYNGEFALYSGFHHDYQVMGDLMIDGGGESYIRTNLGSELITFTFKYGECVEVI